MAVGLTVEIQEMEEARAMEEAQTMETKETITAEAWMAETLERT